MDATGRAIFEIGFVLLLAVLGGTVARRLGLPAVLGYLAAGLVVSPFTPGYVADRGQLHLLADIGVVLLLFEVGIEIDPIQLGRERKRLLVAAPIQTIMTFAVTAVAVAFAGLSMKGALLVGLAVAMSSSVVVVNMTRSRRRSTDQPTELALVGWSVIQDITGVVIALGLLAMLGLTNRSGGVALALVLLYIALAIGIALLVPFVLRHLSDEQDLFLIVSVATALAVAGAGSLVFGVPLALAAFVAGLAISESPVTTEARQRLLPFRDVFAVLFFVSIGALIDPGQLVNGLGWLLLLLALLIVAKVAVSYALARLARLASRPWQLAIGLGQIGEFSFVLAGVGLTVGAIPGNLYEAMLSAVALTIAGSTILVRLGPRVAKPAVA
ncbi:MAG TPA: cation:proton antiporter [Candidatus Dormibacteraeota bacterium]